MTQLTNSSTSTIPLPESWIEKMFHKMLLDYGKKFTDQWGGADTDELIAHWASEMAGYSGAEIKRGLASMETRDWPPTLPEFKKMCRAPVDSLVAYYEAVAGVQARNGGDFGKWSHPAIYWAAMPLAFDLGSQTYSQVKPRWERALAEQMDRGEWLEIPRPMLALSLPGTAALSRENAEQMLRQLKAATISKKATDTIDHKAWARRILDRERRKDSSLSLLQVKFAKEAMAEQDPV